MDFSAAKSFQTWLLGLLCLLAVQTAVAQPDDDGPLTGASPMSFAIRSDGTPSEALFWGGIRRDSSMAMMEFDDVDLLTTESLTLEFEFIPELTDRFDPGDAYIILIVDDTPYNYQQTEWVELSSLDDVEDIQPSGLISQLEENNQISISGIETLFAAHDVTPATTVHQVDVYIAYVADTDPTTFHLPVDPLYVEIRDPDLTPPWTDLGPVSLLGSSVNGISMIGGIGKTGSNDIRPVRFYSSEELSTEEQVDVAINMEITHAGEPGSVHLLVNFNGVSFVRVAGAEAWSEFDGTLDGFFADQIFTELPSSIEFVYEDVNFLFQFLASLTGSENANGGYALFFYLAYQVEGSVNDIFYNSFPLQIGIDTPGQ